MKDYELVVLLLNHCYQLVLPNLIKIICDNKDKSKVKDVISPILKNIFTTIFTQFPVAVGFELLNLGSQVHCCTNEPLLPANIDKLNKSDW
jgi:hypothetical protein